MNDALMPILGLSAFYGFGALGLFSIGAFPLRACSYARRAGRASRPTLYIAALAVVSFTAVVFATQPLVQLGRCLLGYHCSANSAGGWINAAYLGVVYVCFEFGLLVLRWTDARHKIAT